MTPIPKPTLQINSTQAFTIKKKPEPLKPEEDTPEGWFNLWKSSNQSPEAGAGLLRAMDPHIEAATRKYAGSTDPVTMAEARRLFVTAVPRYDGRASLQTFADRQLQPLTRWKARKELPVRVPTLKVRQITAINDAEADLEAELGRSPSFSEIADHTGIPIKQIQQLQKLRFPMLTDQQFADEEGGVSSAGDFAVEDDNHLWLQTVYHSLGPSDQVILQHSTGLYNAPVLSNQQIARKLRISPGAVSQRRNKIQQILDREVDF